VSRGPAWAAASVQEQAARLRSRGEQLRQDSTRPISWAARAGERAAGMLARAEELLALANRLRQGERWPVGLPAVRDGEGDRLSRAGSEDLPRRVDGRLREALCQAGTFPPGSPLPAQERPDAREVGGHDVGPEEPR
jgi:hypothetical protein